MKLHEGIWMNEDDRVLCAALIVPVISALG